MNRKSGNSKVTILDFWAKRRCKKQSNLFFTTLIIGMIGISGNFYSCYEPKEGCLDLEATNYDVTADDPCNGCCNYPALNIAFRHLYIPPDLLDTTIFFRYNNFYPVPDNPLDTFTVERTRFFLSNIRLVRPDGSELHVMDSITIDVNGTSTRIADNFAKVDRDIFQTVNIGTIITEGKFSAVRFNVGLDDFLLNTDPESVPTTSQLNVRNDTLLYMDTINISYLSALVVFNQDTIAVQDSTVVQIFEQTNLIEVPFEEVFQLDPGFNIKVTIDINYWQWFQGIDIKNTDQNQVNAALRNQILENIAASFSIFKIE